MLSREELKAVDNEARTQIAVIEQKVQHMSELLSHHMEYEEKQRDKLEGELNGIGRRVGGLNKLIWLTIGVTGGPEIMQLLGSVPFT